MDEAKSLIMALDGMEECEQHVTSWLARLDHAGKDPLVYARAFVMKRPQLDMERGPAGFFIRMAQDHKEDEWLKFQIKRCSQDTERVPKEAWPYEAGNPFCRVCDGAGWYVRVAEHLDDLHGEALIEHELSGWPALRYSTGVERIVFICKSCHPGGFRLEEKEMKKYHQFPVTSPDVTAEEAPF